MFRQNNKMLKGYIEGYYGRLFSQEERSLLLRHMGKLKMDFYLYGPKEDPYHRVLWEKPYPSKYEKVLEDFVKQSKKNKIRPVFAISPGLKGNKSTAHYRKFLAIKIKQAKRLGFEEFAIFFDDIDHKRDEGLATKHLEILELVSSFNIPANDLWVCPTVYCKSFAKGSLIDNKYLKTLAKGIDPDVKFLWTGDEVVSESIKSKGIVELKGLFSNPIIIWDNYYANDYCPTRYFIGSYLRRGGIKNQVEGVGINPTGLVLTDSICLDRFVLGLKDNEILKKYDIPKDFRRIMPYFQNPFKETPPLTLAKIDKLLDTQYSLCIQWKSNLQLEWAPFLWKFYLDLILLKKMTQKDTKFNLEEWIKRRYSDPLRKTILKN